MDNMLGLSDNAFYGRNVFEKLVLEIVEMVHRQQPLHTEYTSKFIQDLQNKFKSMELTTSYQPDGVTILQVDTEDTGNVVILAPIVHFKSGDFVALARNKVTNKSSFVLANHPDYSQAVKLMSERVDLARKAFAPNSFGSPTFDEFMDKMNKYVNEAFDSYALNFKK